MRSGSRELRPLYVDESRYGNSRDIEYAKLEVAIGDATRNASVG